MRMSLQAIIPAVLLAANLAALVRLSRDIWLIDSDVKAIRGQLNAYNHQTAAEIRYLMETLEIQAELAAHTAKIAPSLDAQLWDESLAKLKKIVEDPNFARPRSAGEDGGIIPEIPPGLRDKRVPPEIEKKYDDLIHATVLRPLATQKAEP